MLVDEFTKLIKANKHDTIGYIYRGLAYEAMKDYDAAKSDYKEVCKLTPKDPGAHLKLGIIYCETQDYYHSIKEFTNSIKLDSLNAIAFNNRGNSYYIVGDIRSAPYKTLKWQLKLIQLNTLTPIITWETYTSNIQNIKKQ